jgi:NADH-quinone oxidoreductase subunit N
VFDNAHSVGLFLPELILGVGILISLLVDLAAGRPHIGRSALLATTTLVMALAATVITTTETPIGLFGGLLARDLFGDFFRVLFMGAGLATILLSVRSKQTLEISSAVDSAEYFALLLATVLAMSLMASAMDLLPAFLSFETVSIISYLLTGYRFGDRNSSEAALKYVIYGGVAAGVLLYGMSLLFGLSGATHFTAIQRALAHSGATGTVLAAVVLCLAGFGYKIAAVPFHMWCPDVYEGAPTPVTAFFSVGPKAAGFALLLRFFQSAVPNSLASGASPWPMLLIALAISTMTIGNLAAIAQSSVKRLFAYSSIAHAGYLLLGFAVAGEGGTRAVLIYLVVYLFMNFGAFAVVSAISDAGVGENLLDYRGLGARAPFPAAMMVLFVCSLVGLPPFAGFFAKLYVFSALIEHGGALMVGAAIVGALNSALSLYYYARLLRAMYFEAPSDQNRVRIAGLHSGLLAACAAPTVALCFVWSPLVRFVESSLSMWLE